MASRPFVRVRPAASRALARGLPWVYERQIDWGLAGARPPSGAIVDVLDDQGQAIATAAFEQGVPIALRCWAHQPHTKVDSALLRDRLSHALALRQRCLDAPFYRLVHADADGMPGVICDRYGDVLVVDLAPCAHLLDEPLVAAIEAVLQPRTVLLRRDDHLWVLGEPLQAPVQVEEQGVRYLADLVGGQKTGWYYDQRAHRAFAATCARGVRVLDAFCYTGGFAIRAALGGASAVRAVDRSAPALALAAQAAELNGVASSISFERANLLADLPAGEAQRYGLVICDPPPLARQADKRSAAAKVHRHLARQGAAALEHGGVLLQASCSHALSGQRFLDALLKGLGDAGRRGTIIHRGGAGPDHPVHPLLPQSAYLDVVGLRVD